MPDPVAHRQAEAPAVCIVDDDEGVAESLTVLLETFGFDAQSYGSGADFLADSRHRTAACLIIDQHMPGMTGLDVVALLQREGIRCPTILISGRLDTKASEQAARLSVTRIVEKPFEAGRLVDLIARSCWNAIDIACGAPVAEHYFQPCPLYKLAAPDRAGAFRALA
jgi:two-component system, LuxR family, response regulator FixJ